MACGVKISWKTFMQLLKFLTFCFEFKFLVNFKHEFYLITDLYFETYNRFSF